MNRLLDDLRVVKRVVFAFVMVLAISPNCTAADIGIGISVKESDQSIYVPIKLSDSLKTEFSVGYSSREQNDSSSKHHSKSLEAGIGLFLLKDVTDNTQLYYGCRFLYINTDYYYAGIDGYYSSDKLNGYGIVPTLGFEYYFNDHISLGGEAGYYYKNLDGESYYATDYKEKTTGTNCRVILRYYF